MSSFLHSEAWQSFQEAAGHHTQRHQGQLYIGQKNQIAPYLVGSRLHFEASSTLPKTSKHAFLRLEPEDDISLEQLHHLTSQALRSTFAVQPRQTSIVSLCGNEEEQMTSWSSKHRYNLRLARKKGVQIESYTSDAPAQFERFWSLLSLTAERQHFRTHAREYYQKMLEILSPLGQAHLLIASYDQEDLATLLLITNQETATYLHGASSDAHKELMAPFPLHLQAMQLAQASGCQLYDLWGTDAIQDKDSKWISKEGASSAGVTRFKLGFGGDIIQYPGTFDVILDPIRYSAYTLLRRLRGGQRSFS